MKTPKRELVEVGNFYSEYRCLACGHVYTVDVEDAGDEADGCPRCRLEASRADIESEPTARGGRREVAPGQVGGLVETCRAACVRAGVGDDFRALVRTLIMRAVWRRRVPDGFELVPVGEARARLAAADASRYERAARAALTILNEVFNESVTAYNVALDGAAPRTDATAPPPVLWVTFEAGLVVGTFADEAAAWRQREARCERGAELRRYALVERTEEDE